MLSKQSSLEHAWYSFCLSWCTLTWSPLLCTQITLCIECTCIYVITQEFCGLLVLIMLIISYWTGCVVKYFMCVHTGFWQSCQSIDHSKVWLSLVTSYLSCQSIDHYDSKVWLSLVTSYLLCLVLVMRSASSAGVNSTYTIAALVLLIRGKPIHIASDFLCIWGSLKHTVFAVLL